MTDRDEGRTWPGKVWPEGVPCDHPGCLHHVSHPCEGCGRIAGRYVRAEPTVERHEPAEKHVRVKNSRFPESYRHALRAEPSGDVGEERHATCSDCGRPATCVGSYEMHPARYACDVCCGHGNEDGWCLQMEEIPEALARLRRTPTGGDG